MSGKTTGVFELLLRVRISQHVRGRVTNGAFLPNTFQHVFRNRRKKREAHLTWGPDRSLHTQLIPPVRKGREKIVPMGMRRSTIDPITAMLTFITQPMTGSPCNQSARVFEGRRRVNARLLMVKTEPMPSTYLSGLPTTGRHCHLFAGTPTHWRRPICGLLNYRNISSGFRRVSASARDSAGFVSF
jgi:hypothetical protein